ncbi:MAG: Tex family protein [Desulfobacterales bacterium]|nr:Tex family protein [Desulfobacterales bacterium]MDD3951622.1 Tex family protein [Desulfobacterales bacterium]
MNPFYMETIAAELAISPSQVQAVTILLEAQATIPFIARYRKEATGSLDEVAVGAIRDRLEQLQELDARKAAVLKSLEQNGHLTDELKQSIAAAQTLAEVEDIYLPYRPKRRTRAGIAREKGLEPLTLAIFAQTGMDPESEALSYLDSEKGVLSVEDALSGAQDIMAEMINESAEARSRMRELFFTRAVFSSRVAEGKEAEGAKFKDYFDWAEPVCDAPSHRILAMRRGENEDILNLNIAPPEAEALVLLESIFVHGDGPDSERVRSAAADAYKRLLSRSMETEIRLALKERADAEAIRIFAENLRQLLLAPPLGARRVMGIDPGFRTGCKVVCLNREGKFLHHETIYPHQSEKAVQQAADTIVKLCRDFEIEAIAVGNGTAGRETETFIRSLDLASEVTVVMVNESGASIYSASEAARKEFPNLDLTVRGAISIGRRLMDPLAELVKIDPKSIGVGQYQHDVDQTGLRRSLDDTVVSCVNAVGVDLNRASVQLLTYVSGLGPQLAGNIVACRDENGAFDCRQSLKKVPRLGPKAFEQCAGFLRIRNGRNPLDASAVHPESYPVVEKMAADLNCAVSDLMKDPALRSAIDITRYVSETVGLPTLQDIVSELAKPGRDPRKDFETIRFAKGIETIQDLKPGMRLSGIVTNVTAFGAFVDIGVHQDGLVHVSQLADRFVKDPSRVVKVQQKVQVTVLEVDLDRKRISLSMRSQPENTGASLKPSSSKTQPQKRPKQERTGPQPFNNPFADLLRK